MKNNLISVIIPVYNNEQYLSRCIDSVINQTYKNLEIILVDDGSTDNSGKICDEYALKDNRIKVIHKENGGVSSARNVGLDIAKGEYIGFVDSDDYIEKDMYEFLYNLILNNNVDISCCNKFDFNNNKYLPDRSFPKEGLLSLNEILQDKAFGLHIVIKLFDKNLIKNIRFNENLTIGEDLLFCFDIIKRSKKTIFKNTAKYYYFNNTNSVIRKKVFKKQYLSVIDVHDYIIHYAKENNLLLAYKKFSKYKINWIISFLARIAEENDVNKNKDSLKMLLKNIKTNLICYLSNNLISIKGKIFLLLCCINFNLASSIYRLMFKLKIKK